VGKRLGRRPGAHVVFSGHGRHRQPHVFDANADRRNNPLTATTDSSGHATLTFTKSGAGTVTINAANHLHSDPRTGNGVSLSRATDPATAPLPARWQRPGQQDFCGRQHRPEPLTATNAVTRAPHPLRRRCRRTWVPAAAWSPPPTHRWSSRSRARPPISSSFDANKDGDNNPLTATTGKQRAGHSGVHQQCGRHRDHQRNDHLNRERRQPHPRHRPATTPSAGPGGSGPASKTFVDANIGLSPLTATNAVTQHHIVTATVKEDFGTGGGLVAADDAPVGFHDHGQHRQSPVHRPGPGRRQQPADGP